MTRLVASLMVLSALLPGRLPAQAPVLKLDHVYIVIQPPAAPSAEALRQAGLIVDTAISRHDGQGTASIAAFFDNAYLELLWVDGAVSVDSAHHDELAEFHRAAGWRESGASPFGVGLHFVTGTPADLPIPVRRDPASHLGPDIYYLLLRQIGEPQAADFFIMPAQAAVTTWLDRYRNRHPELFAHPLGAARITRIVLSGLPANRPRALDLTAEPIAFEPASTQYLTIEFDNLPEGRTFDLRPALPLILRR